MKKVLYGILMFSFMFLLVGCKGCKQEEYEIAMVTDFGDITDQSFNQTTWEAVKDYAKEHDKTYAYYKPANDKTSSRVEKIEQAIKRGAKVVVMPGFAFAEAVYECQDKYPDVKFVALDVSQFDIENNFFNIDDKNFERKGLKDEEKQPHLGDNVVCILFEEHEAGYLAGYAAVMNGETKLGFLGGMAVPAVVRFGSGYIQGIRDAANKKEVDVDLWYIYGGQFYGDSDIKLRMDEWVTDKDEWVTDKDGCETIFACGGGIYTSVVDAIKGKENHKMIGVDTDQSKIEPTKDITVLTSAMKGLREATFHCLDEFYGDWTIGGKEFRYGLKNDEGKEYVGLPRDSWQHLTKFSLDDYDEIIAKIRGGEVTISDEILDAEGLRNLLKDSRVTIKNPDFAEGIK